MEKGMGRKIFLTSSGGGLLLGGGKLRAGRLGDDTSFIYEKCHE